MTAIWFWSRDSPRRASPPSPPGSPTSSGHCGQPRQHHEMVYSGWEPQHPALFQDTHDPHVGGSTYFEGRVV